MYWLIRMAVVFIVAGRGGVQGQQGDSADDRLGHRPPNEIGVLQLDPNVLLGSPFIWLTPIARFVPSHLSPAQLEAIAAERIVVSLGTNERDPVPDESQSYQLTWAAAARLKEPLAVAALLDRWQRATIIPRPRIQPERFVTSDGFEYFRIPSGTFLSRPVRSGELHIEDQSGKQQEQGIDVGDVDRYYQYISGDDRNRAVFEFRNIDREDMTIDHLDVSLECRVHQAKFRGFKPARLRVCVRNPESLLESQPIPFDITPDSEHRLAIPRNISTAENEPSRQSDLLADFVHQGRLQVLVSLEEPFVYVGLGRNSLQLVRTMHEFIRIDGKHVFVADSVKRLQSIIADRDLANALTSRKEPIKELVVAVRLQGTHEKTALSDFLTIEAGFRGVTDFIEQLENLQIELAVTSGVTFRLEAGMTDLADARELSAATGADIASWWTDFREEAIAKIERLDELGKLVSVVFDGVPATFPAPTMMSADRKKELMRNFTGGDEHMPQLNQHGQSIKISFSKPHMQSGNSREEHDFLATLCLAAGQDLITNGRVELGVSAIRPATDHRPDEPALRLRFAHLMAFNAPRAYLGASERYAMVRQAIFMLLEKAEANRDQPDYLWLLARIISRKIGDPWHEAGRLLPLFHADDVLQERIRRLTQTDTNQTTWKSDAWAVSKRLLECAISKLQLSEKSCSVPLILFYSDEALVVAGRAEMLARNGHVDESQEVWGKALELYDDLGREPRITIDSKSYCLFDLYPETTDKSLETRIARLLEYEWDRTDFSLRKSRCEVAQTSALKNAQEAFLKANAVRASSPEGALRLLKSTFDDLDTAFRDKFERMAVAQIVRPEWQMYELMHSDTASDPATDLSEFQTGVNSLNEHAEHRGARLYQLSNDERVAR